MKSIEWRRDYYVVGHHCDLKAHSRAQDEQQLAQKSDIAKTICNAAEMAIEMALTSTFSPKWVPIGSPWEGVHNRLDDLV